MARRGALALGVGGALLAGAAAGFALERLVVRGRLVPDLIPAEVPLGSLAGEVRELDGPRGMRVTVESYGPEDAPQVLLAHGWVCTGRAWHEQVHRLADEVRVITYDQPGHGRTSSPEDGEYDLDLLGDTLATVLTQATRPGPVVIAGHSMGGMTLLNAARRHRAVRDRLAGALLLSTTSSARSERLALETGIRAVARLDGVIRRLVPTLRDPRVTSSAERLYASTSDLSFLLARWTAVGPDADPEVVAFTQEMLLASGFDVVVGLVEPILGVDEDAGLDVLEDVPTTLIVGTHDRLTPPSLTRRMAARSRAGVVELEGVGHMSLLEAGEEVTEVLRRHLDGEVARAEDGRWELAGESDVWQRITPAEAVRREAS
ncbi:MAG: alpha/beta fold hydrolase [Nitriliruptoraceae bacterium]